MERRVFALWLVVVLCSWAWPQGAVLAADALGAKEIVREPGAVLLAERQGRVPEGRMEGFCEVEILLNEQFTLKSARSLPKAPGSKLEVLDDPARVIVQLPAARVGELLNKGAETKVLRKFVLVEGTGRKGEKKEAAPSTSSGQADTKGVVGLLSDDCYGENSMDVSIPEYPDWSASIIWISCAPGGATVSSIDVHFEIIYPSGWVGDAWVWVSDEDDECTTAVFDEPSNSNSSVSRTVTGITICNGEAVNQDWYLWATDTYADEYNGYIDYWWIKVYYGGGPPGPPHDECPNSIPVYEGVPYDGNTIGATGSQPSSCSYLDTKDVWHSYTPSDTNLVTVSLLGSSFDTTLSIFDECDGNELGCNDDTCNELQSELTMVMNGGHTYLIRIAGYNAATGDYTLTVTSNACEAPAEPNNPSPDQGEVDVPVDANLSWNGAGAGMLRGGKASRAVSKVPLTPKIIYGSDDRLDEYEVTDSAILAVGDSVAALLDVSQLTDNGNGTYSLPTSTLAEWYEWADPIYSGNPLCSDEPFRDQPNPAFCSGFLVAEDLVVTAGHCVDSSSCGSTAFVFGFVMLDASTPVLTIDESDVYYCSEVVCCAYNATSDWAIVKLDRPVVGHSPLHFRTEGKVADDEPLLVIGHPVGLPRKYAGGAGVCDNNAVAYFQANVDTYGGNSGSPVFSADTLKVEGVLVRGNADWTAGSTCDNSNVCPEGGCPGEGCEDVVRTTEFAHLLPWEKYDVYFDDVNPPAKLIHNDLDEPSCDPCEGGDLMAAQEYYWKVVARNACGETEGPVWPFATAIPGDIDGSGEVGLNDVDILASQWLQPPGVPSADIALPPDGDVDFLDFAVIGSHWRWKVEP